MHRYWRVFSVMKLKNIFRRKAVVSLKDTSNKTEKEFIRKISTVSHLRLGLSSSSKFRVFENLTFSPPAASLELADYPGHVMRARGLQLVGERKSSDEDFGKIRIISYTIFSTSFSVFEKFLRGVCFDERLGHVSHIHTPWYWNFSCVILYLSDSTLRISIFT